MNLVLLYVAAGMTMLWGIAHLFPTKSVVAGFGDISVDNRRIITMEWIVEGVALIVLGVLVLTVTLIAPRETVSRAVYVISAGALIIFAIVSLFTGFKVRYAPFKLCPVVFTMSAVLILLGGVI